MFVESQSLTVFNRTIFLFVFVFGLISCSAIISADELGRVNLLSYVLFFCLLPLASLLLLIVSSFSQTKSNHILTRCVLAIPLWPNEWIIQLKQLKQQQIFSPWLNYVSHLIGFAFSLGCLAAFTFMLVFSDVAFVWRSTLLSADNIYPILKALALPWQFIDAAQPVKSILINSQEMRFSAASTNDNDYGSWWKFLFVAQVCYALLPRCLGACYSLFRFKRALMTATSIERAPSPLVNQVPQSVELTPLASERPSLAQYNVVCWLALDQQMLSEAIAGFSKPQAVYQAGFHGDDEATAMADSRTQLVLVAAWEPPLGELKDFLAHGHGVIMPLDFNGHQWQEIAPHYLDEWRRFTQSQTNWTLFVDKELK